MESIHVETGQHVIIAYEPATLFQRGGAALIDSIVQVLYAIFILMGSSELNLNLLDKPYLLFLLALPVLTYHFFFEAYMGGQTPGKLILKIKVANADGSATSIGSYFMRWLLRPIDMFMGGGIGALFILFTQNHQRVGDLAAGTIVIITKTRNNTEEEYYYFEDNYQPVYPQVENLSEGQIHFIKQILQLDSTDNLSTYYQTSQKVKEKLGIETDIRERDIDFLKRIVKDYNYYASLGV